MKYLLDTHIFLWSLSNVSRLSSKVRDTIASPQHKVYVSVVSAWEIAIKKGLGKLSVPDNMEEEIYRCGFSTLSVTFDQTEVLAALPQHHRDPFDRMLIVQAMTDHLTLITADPMFKAYSVNLLFMNSQT
ncbi:MAG: type II toxin-antitoxin system VapC family toxin [Magnetococcales bacterium]|nr:type II toxin-antitoxin system VapC family toxin [Magnetococcales bacterium]